ncbi:hypothetical protein CCACVL1_01692, partial [Corchorus capsularis]
VSESSGTTHPQPQQLGPVENSHDEDHDQEEDLEAHDQEKNLG